MLLPFEAISGHSDLAKDRGPSRMDAPVRGTQSLVGVMAAVWKRPSLVLLEVAWRWTLGVPVAFLVWRLLSAILREHPVEVSALQGLTVFQPLQAMAVCRAQWDHLAIPIWRSGRWLVPLVTLLWSLASAVGRTMVLRRYDPSFRPRIAFAAVLGWLRLVSLLAVLAVWAMVVRAAFHWCVTVPGQRGDEPNLVLLTALVVGLTLLLFVLWSLSVWLLDLPVLYAMLSDLYAAAAMKQVAADRPLRSKAIELNLVMGIVKVCLLVLTMTLSASPLPFQNQQTATFIHVWWIGALVAYLVASDFFHVVRRVTLPQLMQTLQNRGNTTKPAAS